MPNEIGRYKYQPTRWGGGGDGDGEDVGGCFISKSFLKLKMVSIPME